MDRADAYAEHDSDAAQAALMRGEQTYRGADGERYCCWCWQRADADTGECPDGCEPCIECGLSAAWFNERCQECERDRERIEAQAAEDMRREARRMGV